MDTPRWAGRVPQHKIRRLYANDARGLVDEELIDDVGYAMYARCESILTVTRALRARVACPNCQAIIQQTGPKVNCSIAALATGS